MPGYSGIHHLSFRLTTIMINTYIVVSDFAFVRKSAVTITQYGSTVYIVMALVWPVLKEILMITFSLWCTGLLAH